MKYKLTNTEAQKMYWSAENDQFRCKEGSAVHTEMLKLIADSPYNNPKFRPIIDVDVLGYWIGNEAAQLADHHTNYEDTPTRELNQWFDLAAKFAAHVDRADREFKLMYLLTQELDVLAGKMEEMAAMMDKNHPEAFEALKYYSNHVINTLSVEEGKA